MKTTRRLSSGAETTADGVHFRVFAPKRRNVAVVLASDHERTLELTRTADGYFEGLAEGVRPGALYRLRLDDDPKLYPDPASRFQPEGPHGPSEVVDPASFAWTDRHWKGMELHGQVIYEFHVGTFTEEGTYAAAARQLEELREAGITLLEMMPIHEFPGAFGWGYDGVDLYAPTRLYGRPDDLRAFIDRAHALGIGVILDVVYNHVGPDGNYLEQFADSYFTKKYENEWGAAVDFESDPGARAYFAENGAYWIDEFHFDGLRLDATQSIHDASPKHVIAELVEKARAVAKERLIVVVGESEPQDGVLFRAVERGGFGLDALWNDDFHHSAEVARTGRAEAYYTNTKGTPQELASALKWGFLFQGQYYSWQKKCRGLPALDVPAEKFILYLQNHDQVANSGRSARMANDPAARAITALFLLAPGTPMLFQGQEFGASARFRYFADHEPGLAELVRQGRLEFLKQFPSLRDDKTSSLQVAPHDQRAFAESKLDFSERTKNAPVYDLHKDLLRLRRTDPVFARQDRDAMHSVVLADEALALRYLTDGEDRLVLFNLGRDLDLTGIAEPLLAPPAGGRWEVLFSTEDPRYGGSGTPPFGRCGQTTLPGRATLVFGAAPEERTGTDESEGDR